MNHNIISNMNEGETAKRRSDYTYLESICSAFSIIPKV